MTRSDSFDTLLTAGVKTRVAAQTQPNTRLAAAAKFIGETVTNAIAAFREWRQVSRSRRELATLDDYQLRDIGLSRSQAMFESGKVFLQH